MKKLFMATLAIIVLVPYAYAGQKYNPYTGKFVTVPDDYEMKYNPYENNFSYQNRDAQIEHNPYENKFEWNPEPKSYKYRHQIESE